MDFAMPGRREVVLSEFRIFETDEFLKRLEKLASGDGAFVREKLDSYVYPQLRNQPFFGKNVKKLRGYTPDTWRYRIRTFRMFYSIDKDDMIVYILTIEDRKEAYR